MANPIQCCFARVEKKYMLSPAQYQQILQGIHAYVRPDQFGSYTICNIYYDTDDYRLIRTSLEKPVYKEKLRMRSYGVPGEQDKVFVELKKKYDGIVYKRRVVMEAAQAAAYLSQGVRPENEGQIHREIDWFVQSYQPIPKVFLSYDREAYAGLENPELRITFDTNLRWRETDLDLRCGNFGTQLLDDTQILMELKIPGAAPMWLAHLLSAASAFPTSFSKYGMYYKQEVLEKQLFGRGLSASPAHSTLHIVKKEAQVCA